MSVFSLPKLCNIIEWIENPFLWFWKLLCHPKVQLLKNSTKVSDLCKYLIECWIYHCNKVSFQSRNDRKKTYLKSSWYSRQVIMLKQDHFVWIIWHGPTIILEYSLFAITYYYIPFKMIYYFDNPHHPCVEELWVYRRL